MPRRRAKQSEHPPFTNHPNQPPLSPLHHRLNAARRLALNHTPAPRRHLRIRAQKRHPQLLHSGEDPIATPFFSTPRPPQLPRRVSETPPPRRLTSSPQYSPVLPATPGSKFSPRKRPRVTRISETPAKPRVVLDTPVRPYFIPETPVRPQIIPETPVRPQVIPETPVRLQIIPETPIRTQVVAETPVQSGGLANFAQNHHCHPPSQPILVDTTSHHQPTPRRPPQNEKLNSLTHPINSHSNPLRKRRRTNRVFETPGKAGVVLETPPPSYMLAPSISSQEPPLPVQTPVIETTPIHRPSPVVQPRSSPEERRPGTTSKSSSPFMSPGLLTGHITLTVESLYSNDGSISQPNSSQKSRHPLTTTQRRISFGVASPKHQARVNADTPQNSASAASPNPDSHPVRIKTLQSRLKSPRPESYSQQKSSSQSPPQSFPIHPPAQQLTTRVETSPPSNLVRASSQKAEPVWRSIKHLRHASLKSKVFSPSQNSIYSWAAPVSAQSPSPSAAPPKEKFILIEAPTNICVPSPLLPTARASTPTDSEPSPPEENVSGHRKLRFAALQTQDFFVLKPRRVGQSEEEAIKYEEAEHETDEQVQATQVSEQTPQETELRIEPPESGSSSTQSPVSLSEEEKQIQERCPRTEGIIYGQSVSVPIASGALRSTHTSESEGST